MSWRQILVNSNNLRETESYITQRSNSKNTYYSLDSNCGFLLLCKWCKFFYKKLLVLTKLFSFVYFLEEFSPQDIK